MLFLTNYINEKRRFSFFFPSFFSQFWKNSYVSKLWSDFSLFLYWSKWYFCVRTDVMFVCSGARVNAAQRATLHCRSCEHLNTSGLLNNILDLLFHRSCPCCATETPKMWTYRADILTWFSSLGSVFQGHSFHEMWPFPFWKGDKSKFL